MKNIIKNNKLRFFTFLLAGIFMLGTTACSKHDDHDDHDDHDHDHENELITTVRLHLIETGTTDTVSYAWKQVGGPGSAIVVDSIILKQGKVYNAYTEVLDESATPTKNLTESIKTACHVHRFIYTSTISSLILQVLDFDTQTPAMELGLKFRITTPDVMESGNLKCVLKHYTSSDPKTNGINAGSSDIEVQFPLFVN
jgi:hypothetical protein